MAKIRFNLDRSRKTHKYIMCIYYIRPNQRLKVSTSIKVKPHQWDKAKHRCIETDEGNSNNAILDNIERCIIETVEYYNKLGVSPGVDILREKIQEITAPKQLITLDTTPQKFSRQNYFRRFYDLVAELGTHKEAYYEVENEWNSQGVAMFDTYSAFTVGKHRFLNGASGGFKIKAL